MLADFRLPFDVTWAANLADWAIDTDTPAAGVALYRLMMDGIEIGTVSVAGSTTTLPAG